MPRPDRRRIVPGTEPMEGKALLALTFTIDPGALGAPPMAEGETHQQAMDRLDATIDRAEAALADLVPIDGDARVAVVLQPAMQPIPEPVTPRPSIRFPRTGWRETNLNDIRQRTADGDDASTTMLIEIDPAFFSTAWIDPEAPSDANGGSDRVDFVTAALRGVLQGLAFNGAAEQTGDRFETEGDDNVPIGTPFDKLSGSNFRPGDAAAGNRFDGPRAHRIFGNSVPISTATRPLLVGDPSMDTPVYGYALDIPGDLMDEMLPVGQRLLPSDLDRAIVMDVGSRMADFQADATAMAEGSGPFSVRFIYGGPLPSDTGNAPPNDGTITFVIDAVGGSAMAVDDFGAPSMRTIAIAPGAEYDQIAFDLTLPIVDDTDLEPGETVDLVATSDNGTPDDASDDFEAARITLTILDDDDTTGPGATGITDVTPDPRRAPVDSLDVVFSEAIDPATFTVDDLRITRDGLDVPLTPAVTIERIDDATYRINGLTDPTRRRGSYEVAVELSGIADLAGNMGEGRIVEQFTNTSAAVSGDFDGDGKADLALYRYDAATSEGVFEIHRSTGGNRTDRVAGLTPDDVPVSGDFDGDGITDVAVVQPLAKLGGSATPNASVWIIVRSTDGDRLEVPFGAAGTLDRPAPADFDGDGITDIATFRANSDLVPGAAQWFILPSGPNPGFRSVNGAFAVLFGAAGGADLPAPADFDGDGRADIATFRPESDLAPGAAQWFILPSSTNDATFSRRLGAFPVTFGASGNADQPVVADYNGDGRADIASFRSVTDLPGGERWFLLPSVTSGGVGGGPGFGFDGGFPVVFGVDGDIAAVSDYDLDGSPDLTVYSPDSGDWTIHQSSDDSDVVVSFNPSGRDAVPVLAPLFFRLDIPEGLPPVNPPVPSASSYTPRQLRVLDDALEDGLA